MGWESKEGQNRQTIRKMLNLNDWKIGKVIDIYIYMEKTAKYDPCVLKNYNTKPKNY